MPADDLASLLSRVVETKAEYDVRLMAQQLGLGVPGVGGQRRGLRPRASQPEGRVLQLNLPLFYPLQCYR